MQFTRQQLVDLAESVDALDLKVKMYSKGCRDRASSVGDRRGEGAMGHVQ